MDNTFTNTQVSDTLYNTFILLDNGDWEIVATGCTPAEVVCIELENPTRNIVSVAAETPQVLADGTLLQVTK